MKDPPKRWYVSGGKVQESAQDGSSSFIKQERASQSSTSDELPIALGSQTIFSWICQSYRLSFVPAKFLLKWTLGNIKYYLKPKIILLIVYLSSTEDYVIIECSQLKVVSLHTELPNLVASKINPKHVQSWSISVGNTIHASEYEIGVTTRYLGSPWKCRHLFPLPWRDVGGWELTPAS